MIKHNQQLRGFTLIEMIIAIILMGIVSGLLASIIAVNFKTISKVSDRKKLITQGMLAVELFNRELGMLTDSTKLLIANDQELQFTDKQGDTWDYSVTSGTLTRQEVGVGSAMLLAAPLVNASSKSYYYDGNNTALTGTPLSSTNRKLVRLVKFILVMDDGGSGIPLMATVYPENLKIYNK